MIELKDIKKKYDRFVAFTSPLLSINKAQSLGLVGNNGAGKTTMLRLILDLTKATTGVVTSKGLPVAKSDHWKSYTGSFLDEGFLIPFLRPLEYLEFVGGLSKLTKADVKEFLEENHLFFQTELFQGKKLIRDLSTGNKNKVGILAALIIKPEILILDEPFANLDPGSQSWLKAKLKALNREGMTMIVSSHDLNHITEVASRIILLEEGQIIEDQLTSTETLSKLENYFQVDNIY